jgi:hypothetical protein
MLLQTLKNGIEVNEMKLLNVRVEGRCRSEEFDPGSQQWELVLDESVTAWYEGVPLGKRRIDHHKSISKWINGTTPFLEEEYTSAYNGQIKQTLWTKRGSSKAPPTSPHGEIEKGMRKELMNEYATGWTYSLYGAFEISGRLSTVFRLPKNQLNVNAVTFNGVNCIQLQVILPSGMPAITCYFDPGREYALLGVERSSGNGVLVEKWKVDSLVEAAPGVYYPSQATWESLSQDGKVVRRQTYQASAVVANDSNFSDDLFTIKWPPKTRVRDLITTNKYVVPDAGQPEKPVSEPQSRIPLAATPTRPVGGRSRLWVMVAGVGVVAVLVIVPVSRLRRKK